MLVILSYVGMLIGLIGAVMVIIEAFKTSIMWGIVSLPITCGIGWLVFVFTHWGQSKKGFLIWLVGFIIQMATGGATIATAFMHR